MRTFSGQDHRARTGNVARGFTLVELMITMIVLAIVMVVMLTVLTAMSRSKTDATQRSEASQSARIAIDMLTSELRSAGYGAESPHATLDQPAIAYIDSLQVLFNANLAPLTDTPGSYGEPLAYEPAGWPRPQPLDGTLWEPPVRYTTGAELIRWTIDRNNDGIINAFDAAGTEATRTANPDDYVLLREVYGDSTVATQGFNGGAQERIALIRRPAANGVPPLFTVYFKDETEPWNWSSGPVPPARLQEIERIVVNLVATSPRPNSKGQFVDTKYTTEVNSLRNVPDFGADEFTVDGFVYNDVDGSDSWSFGDIGIPNMEVRMNGLVGHTNALGYYRISAHEGSYTVSQTAVPQWTTTTTASVAVTLPPSTTVSFGNKPNPGGYVRLWAHVDKEGDGYVDGSEEELDAVTVVLNGTTTKKTTPLAGYVDFFVPEGAYTFAISAPDSYRVTTTNPITGTIADGDSATFLMGLNKSAVGRVAGKVYLDMDKDGVLDTGETGVQNVWVGVTTDGGYNVLQFQNTDASGDYSFEVPMNSPPATTPYSIMIIPPAGHYGTTTTSINGVYITDGQLLTGQNFGLGTFQIISLTTSRVLSLASGDVIEKDWNGNATGNARVDADILLGAESIGTDQISVWFNKYNSNPLFSTTRDYARTAPQSVLALAADTLDRNAPVSRMDVVTGTKNAGAGNFFVWFTQGSSNNEGYLTNSYSQAYRTLDAGDVHVALTADVAGGQGPDIIVGTNGVGYKGTFEIWQNSDATTPTFSRQEIYPPAGNISGNPAYFGDIYGICREDFDGDGFKDLVVATQTTGGTGEFYFFKFVSKVNGSRFTHRRTITTADPISAVTTLDVDGDGDIDVVLGHQSASGVGSLTLWRNDGSWNFTLVRTVTAPGLPLALTAANLGGTTRKDIVLGYRNNTSSFVGGVRIYSTDAGTISAFGVDPTGGAVTNMVPAMTVNNFNYGVKPSTPSPPYLLDLAVGVKISDSLGALVVMVR